MNTSTLLLDNVQLEKPHFTSVNFSNETIAKFTDSQLFLQHFLEKLKLINTHNYLVTNYETNINYGYEVNYMLYNYLVYFQLKNNQKLGGFSPRI